MPARPASRILSAAELQVAKKAAKAEVTGHATTLKTSEGELKAAKKALDAAHKEAGLAFAVAQKAHVAALKEANKTYDAIAKEKGKAINGAKNAHRASSARLEALAPKPASPLNSGSAQGAAA